MNRATTYSRGLIHYHRRRGLNFRVRKGNGCGPSTMITRKLLRPHLAGRTAGAVRPRTRRRPDFKMV
jgi:hypothetical protein